MMKVTEKYLFILLILLTALGSCRTLYVAETELAYNRVSEQVTEGDPKVNALIQPYRTELRASMDEVISVLDVDLKKERPESNMGNWLADIFYEEANEIAEEDLDFAVLNQGGLRLSSLAKGPVLRGEIYELIPFDNIVSVIEATGEEVMLFLHHIAEGKGWPVSHHVHMTIEHKAASDVMISGSPVDLTRTYRFAVPDYIAGGGSGSRMLKKMDRTDYDALIRELVIDHLREDHAADIIQSPVIEGRIINKDNNE